MEEIEKQNKNEVVEPTPQEQISAPESEIVLVERESTELESRVQQSDKDVERFASQFDTQNNLEEEAGSQLDPRIVGYFREQLGPEETLKRLRHLGPEWIPKIQDAILAGKLETVAYYMSLADPENNPEATITNRAGNQADYRTREEWLAAIDEDNRQWSSHMLSYGAKQMGIIEDIKKHYDPEQKYGAHYAGPKFDAILDTLGINKKETAGPQEEAIKKKLQSIPKKMSKLRAALSGINPETRRIIVSDEDILNATEEDFERWQGNTHRPRTQMRASLCG